MWTEQLFVVAKKPFFERKLLDLQFSLLVATSDVEGQNKNAILFRF